MNEHLEPCSEGDNPHNAKDPIANRTMALTQCYCDGCSNSFYVEGGSNEFLPKQCCYCGATFGEVEEIAGLEDDGDSEDNEFTNWGSELFE